MFKITNIDLGDVLPEKELIIEFPYEGIKKINKMVVFCDCTRVYNYRRDHKIVVKYVPKKIVAHLEQVSIVKRVIVYFSSEAAYYEETEQALTFVAKVVKEIRKEENGSV